MNRAANNATNFLLLKVPNYFRPLLVCSTAPVRTHRRGFLIRGLYLGREEGLTLAHSPGPSGLPLLDRGAAASLYIRRGDGYATWSAEPEPRRTSAGVVLFPLAPLGAGDDYPPLRPFSCSGGARGWPWTGAEPLSFSVYG
jgi:hypothetical protein